MEKWLKVRKVTVISRRMNWKQFLDNCKLKTHCEIRILQISACNRSAIDCINQVVMISIFPALKWHKIIDGPRFDKKLNASCIEHQMLHHFWDSQIIIGLVPNFCHYITLCVLVMLLFEFVGVFPQTIYPFFSRSLIRIVKLLFIYFCYWKYFVRNVGTAIGTCVPRDGRALRTTQTQHNTRYESRNQQFMSTHRIENKIKNEWNNPRVDWTLCDFSPSHFPGSTLSRSGIRPTLGRCVNDLSERVHRKCRASKMVFIWTEVTWHWHILL